MENGESLLNGHRVSFWSDNMFWNYIELVVTHIVNILNAIELFTSKWIILWYMASPIWYNPYKKVSSLALFPNIV